MLDLEPRAQPPAGTVTPADLYIDRASRQMWLGVDPSVDASGSLLIADIVQTLEKIDEAETEAKAYADTQVNTRAPTVHTHSSSQITDFAAAVDARIAASPTSGVPIGSILMYSGALVDIGAGPWANWALCNGSNGTPDLRDKFIYGAGNVAARTKNDAKDLVIPNGGAHSHGGATDPTTLTAAQLPAHTHSVSGSFSGSGSGSTNTAGAHNHDAGEAVLSGSAGGTGVRQSQGLAVPKNVTTTDGAHAHSVSVSVSGSISGTAASAGGGGGHSHPIPNDPGHTHSVPAVLNSVRDSLNWVALAFVMKIS